jgi:hypothetical protein
MTSASRLEEPVTKSPVAELKMLVAVPPVIWTCSTKSPLVKLSAPAWSLPMVPS